MPAIAVNPPFPLFTDADGQPLDDAYIYIGTANQNPVSNPITVYWDSALTITAAQPIRTSGGYPVYNGSPARFYTNSNYSILVRDKNGAFVYTAASETDFISSEFVTFVQSGTGAVARSVQTKLRETVSVRDFGAVGDGVTDDTAAFVAARDYVASVQGVLNIPAGTYRLQQATSLKANNTKWVFAPGAVLKLVDTQATTSFLTFSSPINQRIYGMRVNANRPVQNAALFGVDNCAVLVVDATNCTFDDIEIINSPAKGFALVSSPTNFCRAVSITNFTGADCAEQVLIVDGNNITGFFERIVIDNVKIGTTSSYGLCLNDGAQKVSVSNVIAQLNNTTFDAVFIRDSFDLQLSNIRGSSARNGVSIQRLNGYTGRIELSNVVGEFNEAHGVLLFGAENVTGSQIAALNNKGSGINISQTGASYRCKKINLGSCTAYDNRGTPMQQYGLIIQGVDECRIGTLIAYGNTTKNLSINRAVTSNVQAPTRQVVSGTTGSIPASTNAVVTLNWPTAFDDASVDIESVYVSVSTSSLSLSVTHIVAVTQFVVQVMVRNLGSSAFTGTLTVAGTRTV